MNISLRPIVHALDLETEWVALERRSKVSIFLSWKWIGCWLQVYQPDAKVLRVECEGKLIGLGILVECHDLRHRVLNSTCLRLHQTGDIIEDQIWIEYNGFLAEAGREQEVEKAVVDYLTEQHDDWDEIVFGGVSSGLAENLPKHSGMVTHVYWEVPCYGVDLDALNRSKQSYLESLSRNTRYQINRSKRLYQEQGEVKLVRPGSVEEALGVFDGIAPMHLQRWGSGLNESGFANEEFVRFHRQFISNQWSQGGVDLVSLVVGEKVIASFYNLTHNGTVYFYLSGIGSVEDKHLKPGLLGHSLCIEDYRNREFIFYDFMGGGERYKENLGFQHHSLVQVSLQRPRIKLRLESMARQFRRKFLK